METLACKRCNGSGKNYHKAFTYTDTDGVQKHYPERWDRCFPCDGVGSVPEIDIPALLKAIKGRKGLCSKPPEHRDALAGRRAYYVWRLARFHGGVDVTLPMTAETLSHDDPFRQTLEKLADAVARKAFGTSMAAAARWAPLLGGRRIDPAGMPATAQEGGPVVLAEKPDFELAELS